MPAALALKQMRGIGGDKSYIINQTQTGIINKTGIKHNAGQKRRIYEIRNLKVIKIRFRKTIGALISAFGSKSKTQNMKEEEISYIEYGCFKVGYVIESDLEGNTAILKSIEMVKQTSDDISKFDSDDWEDIKFHCRENYGNRQLQHYLKTGEAI